jgi:hypothetical protein
MGEGMNKKNFPPHIVDGGASYQKKVEEAPLSDEEIFKRGFMAGFSISAEGWNAEYPFRHGKPTDFTQDEFILKKLQQALLKERSKWTSK